jgi:hypothetical protein
LCLFHDRVGNGTGGIDASASAQASLSSCS